MKELDLILDLDEVGGGCATCEGEINPPSVLDATRIQGYLSIAEVTNDVTVHMPHQFQI